MTKFLKKLFFILVICISVFVSSKNVFAETCSGVGYTVLTINGVFTDEIEARKNAYALQRKLDSNTHNSEPLTVDYLHNESHLGGIGDVAKVVYQKIFDNETVEDYDLIEMLKSSSEKVKTQKILLVAHSQGNFYANSFYDTVAGKQGGVPAESIGVYSVATPAGRVAGGGRWLTSDTDKIIAGTVGRVPFKKIMSPNTHIELQNGDDSNGHHFSGVYLKYRGKEIVSDIKNSLDKLKTNTAKNSQVSCIEPPKLTLAHKITGAVFTVADPVAETSIDTAVLTVKTSVKATALAYDATVFGVKTAVKTAVATVSSLTAVAKSLTGSAVANLSESNGASVIATQKTPPISSNNTAVAENKAIFSFAKNKQSALPPLLNSPKDLRFPSLPSKTEIKAVMEKSPPPKLVFVGTRIYGRGSSPPLASVEKIEIAMEKKETEPIAEFELEEELPAPALNTPQCADSLATDGCLLATTTLRFEWAPISGAFYYALSKNGTYATTTETALDAIASDFSDYLFEVATVGVNSRKSATSTKIISVATIPIAINEIAWMGTTASSFDEWLELKNNTNHTISLSQWAVESKDGAPHIALSGSIAPREYLVLERRGDTINIDSSVFTYGNGSSEWALGNGGEELALSYLGSIFDGTPAITEGVWSAGISSDRKTMERYNSKKSGADSSNWGTNLIFVSNGENANEGNINGTPGAKNSLSFLINKGLDITENLTLTADEGNFIIPNRVFVSASSTLTIDPGVEIVFYKNSVYYADGNFNVNGIIDARGTAENPIVFSSYSEHSRKKNGYIWFDSRAGTSTLENVRFENMKDIGLDNSKLEIRNAEFTNTDGGVNAFNGSSVVIENTRFENLTDDVIGAYNNSTITVASTTMDNIRGDGVGVYNSSVITIASTTMDNIRSGDGIGVYNESMLTIASSSIKNISKGDGIGVYNNSVITIVSTTLDDVRGGDGVGAYNDSTLTIASSSIKNISAGDGIGAYNNSTIIIASTTLDEINNGDGVAIYDSTLVIASSTIKNVSEDGIRLSNSTSTISNTLVQNGGENGIDIYGGTVSISDSTVSGFTVGVGVSIDSPESAVAITGGEITDNFVGVAMTEGDATIQDGVVRNNDTDIVICDSLGVCP